MEFDVKKLDVVTPSYAEDHYGFDPADYVGPGVYRVSMGGRRDIEEIEFIGDVDTITLPSLEECIQREMAVSTFSESQDIVDYVTEFYEALVDDGILLFGYNEEQCDYYIKIS